MTDLDTVFGLYESEKCPEEMIQFNIALGATPEEARKKATSASIEFRRDEKNTVESGWLYIVKHGHPLSEYRFPFVLGQAQETLRSNKPVQVVYNLDPAKPGDSVVTLASTFTGIGNDLSYLIEYNFVPGGFLLICSTGSIRAKRWYIKMA